MYYKKIISYCTVLLFTVIISANVNTLTYAKSIKAETPKNVVVKRYITTALKIKWSKVKKADGYRIYRYSSKKKKYVSIKTVFNNEKTCWIDKKLKVHKVYKYKVSSFKVHKGKKKFSKKSYRVSGRTYRINDRLVNAGEVFILENSPISIGLCSENEYQVFINPDRKVKNKKAKPFSKEVIWSSSDISLVKVNKMGKITSFDKEGTCYVYLRAHNGVQKRIKVKVVNFANPKSFSGYEGNDSYVNELLLNYKKEVCNIATYFTVHTKQGVNGCIKSDDDGNIVGIPDMENISAIQNDINKLLTQFPLAIKIYYNGEGAVKFKLCFNAAGTSHRDIIYDKNNEYEESPQQIAPHWVLRRSPGR